MTKHNNRFKNKREKKLERKGIIIIIIIVMKPIIIIIGFIECEDSSPLTMDLIYVRNKREECCNI